MKSTARIGYRCPRATVRSAVALGDDTFKSLSAKLLEDYLVQHQATMDLLKTMITAMFLAGRGDR